jgi:hypothetical protein
MAAIEDLTLGTHVFRPAPRSFGVVAGIVRDHRYVPVRWTDGRVENVRAVALITTDGAGRPSPLQQRVLIEGTLPSERA